MMRSKKWRRSRRKRVVEGSVEEERPEEKKDEKEEEAEEKNDEEAEEKKHEYAAFARGQQVEGCRQHLCRPDPTN